jgi:hypothetical protein
MTPKNQDDNHISSEKISPTSDGQNSMSMPMSFLTQGCFFDGKSLPAIAFESTSRFRLLSESAMAKSRVRTIHIPASVEMLRTHCFHLCKYRPSIIFELVSKHQRIHKSALGDMSLTTIYISLSVEMLWKYCFYVCTSLVAVPFESTAQVQRNEASVFQPQLKCFARHVCHFVLH